MKAKDDKSKSEQNLTAAEWIVALDSESVDQATNDAFIEWLQRRPENQASFENAEAMLALTAELKDDPDLAWAFEESARLAGGKAAENNRRSPLQWFSRHKLGWGLAGTAAIALALAFSRMGEVDPSGPTGASTNQMADTPAALQDVIGPEVVVLPVATTTTPQPEAFRFEAGGIPDDETRRLSVESESALDTRIREARAEIERLQLLFTDRHPDVLRARSTLETLTRQQAADLDAGDISAAGTEQESAASIDELIELVSQGEPQASGDPADGRVSGNYLISPGDRLHVLVWREDELSTATAVQADGSISTPLVDDLMAAGKTPDRLAKDIEQVLSAYLRSPVVSVVVEGLNDSFTNQIRVLGEVETPGIVDFQDGMTLVDVINEAGGLTDLASGNRSRILRSVDGETIETPVRLSDFFDTGNQLENPPVFPGDVIVIPPAQF